MKKLFLYLMVSFFIGCSSVSVINDSFDNSQLVKLVIERNEFIPISGDLRIDHFVLSKEYKAGSNIAKTKLFCKFEGYEGQVLEGNTIEIKTDNVIHNLKLNETRLGVVENISTSSATTFNWIGAYTYTDVSRSNVNIIVMETAVSNQVLEAMKNAKNITFRVLAKNIDGIKKNTFRYAPYSSNSIKDFVNYQKID